MLSLLQSGQSLRLLFSALSNLLMKGMNGVDGADDPPLADPTQENLLLFSPRVSLFSPRTFTELQAL
jgi:hypothetical protein